MQVLSFVGQAKDYDSIKISFLAMDYAQNKKLDDKNLKQVVSEPGYSHCVVSLDKIFEKKLARDLSYISVKKTPLGAKSRSDEFQKHVASAEKMDFRKIGFLADF